MIYLHKVDDVYRISWEVIALLLFGCLPYTIYMFLSFKTVGANPFYGDKSVTLLVSSLILMQVEILFMPSLLILLGKARTNWQIRKAMQKVHPVEHHTDFDDEDPANPKSIFIQKVNTIYIFTTATVGFIHIIR